MRNEHLELPPDLTIQRAERADANAIASIHDDAMRWAFARGFRMSGPPETLEADALRRIGEYGIYIAWHGDVRVGAGILARYEKVLRAGKQGRER